MPLVFICLMAYRPSWVFKCPNHPYRITAVALFNSLMGKDKGVNTFPKGIRPNVNVIVSEEYEHASFEAAVQLLTPWGLLDLF